MEGSEAVALVHPQYYSSELKKYVGRLIYIPYFVVSDDVPEHFVTLPAVAYAEQVILHSEIVKDTYQRVYTEWISEKQREEEKITGRVNQEYWNQLKKITDEKFIVKSSSKIELCYMQKILSVFQQFKDNPEVVLWWRPHPLLQSTLDSMIPQLSPVYQQIVRQYRTEGWGIYDDTPDVTRAVVATDAYYGDWSSVVTLYQATKKPIMIQNLEMDSVIP